MAVTAFASPSSTSASGPDLTLLNVSRLVTRLEHNLLTPGAEVRSLRRDGFQRMRVNKNVEYALTLLNHLERSLPQLKSLDKKHAAQTEIARDKTLLKRMQAVLDEVEQDANREDNDDYEGDGDAVGEGAEEWADVFSPRLTVATERVVSVAGGPGLEQRRHHPISDLGYAESRETNEAESGADGAGGSTLMPTTTATATTTTPPPAPTATTTSTLRNRHKDTSNATATTSGSAPSIPDQKPSKLAGAEQTLSTQRLEQEDLTSSLLTLATQLKTSSQSFQASLTSEKSVLDRAVHGIDRTTTTMEAAGRRMGMLRRMTEGKGWWGRMMLYAWIFGLWVVALLIVFVGPKLRF